MKTIFILFFTLLLGISSTAQNYASIVGNVKGKVIDSRSNEPVSYTNIAIEGTFYGTASDEEGNFDLKIPEELADKNIYFSAIGFINFQLPVSSLLEKEFNIIKIESQSYNIDDVDISVQNKVLVRILRMASENIAYNFFQGPHNLSGIYSSDQTRDSITNKRQAEVFIYDQKGYVTPSIRDAYQSVKYKLDFEPSDEDYRFRTGSSHMDDLLAIDWARSASSVLNPDLTPGFKLELLDEPEINGKSCWRIAFQQAKPNLSGAKEYHPDLLKGEIVINQEDYAVIRIKGETKASKNSLQERSIAINASGSDFLSDVSTSFSIQYKNLLPESIELHREYNYNGKRILENAKLQVTQVETHTIQTMNSRQYFTGH